MYMLDTDICAFLLRRSSPKLLDRIQATPLQEQMMSVVTFAELLYGVEVSARKKSNQQALDELARHLAIADWTSEAARRCATIRAALRRKGAMIGANDLLIAAHAASLGATVVTNNVKEFRRVAGLKVENWMD